MLQTLFVIPHWLFEGPLLIAWLIIGALVLVYLYAKNGNSNDTWSFLPVFGIVALMIHFVLPMLEVEGIDPSNPEQFTKLGLAIRGYGLFLLTAITAGVVLVLSRAKTVGLTTDQILGLGFWMMVTGIAGTRIFYVVQKSDDFFGDGFSLATLQNVLDMTKGGLVVYGSLIGGMVAGVTFLKLNKLPLARTADLIAPGMVIGLAIGRLGCLMNGCCFGGVCDAPLPSVTFPAGSAPYMKQLSEGELLGVTAKLSTNESAYPLVAEAIAPNSIAAELGLQAGDEFAVVIDPPFESYLRFQKEQGAGALKGMELLGFIHSKRLGEISFPATKLPARSLNTHPTQIYSAINAGLLCLVLWFYWTVRKFDGEVFGLMLILYSIGRFLMELIRQDELGQFGTQLTISQWVSVCMVLLGAAIFVYVRTAGTRSSQAPVLGT